jgi:hypothetical protein
MQSVRVAPVGLQDGVAQILRLAMFAAVGQENVWHIQLIGVALACISPALSFCSYD